ncbi:MAG: protein-export chaperone SecB [Gammaproteobacteria bacterium]|nr:protein-export chaperone SecB [Gammaproteobacteria bacterium]
MSENETKQQFGIQKLYLKDSSFESPGAPKSFQFQQWDPKVELNMGNKQQRVGDNLYEVVLTVTVTVSQDDTTMFLVEVQQAGLFAIVGYDEDELAYLLGSQCMTLLFPYVREAISDISIRGGFPPLLLSPVNFDALYQQHLEAQQEKQDGDTVQ